MDNKFISVIAWIIVGPAWVIEYSRRLCKLITSKK
jgi:hypothetical protein